MKPFTLDIVIVDVPVTPGLRVSLFGLAVKKRSWTVKMTVVEWERDPLVLVTVTE